MVLPRPKTSVINPPPPLDRGGGINNPPKNMKNYANFKSATTIPQIWKTLKLPGAPSKSCFSPFREDHKPSFSVYDQGRKFKDFSTGDSGSVIDFLLLAFNGNKKLTNEFINGALENPSEFIAKASSCPSEPVLVEKSIKLPGELLEPSVWLIEQFAESRGFSLESSIELVKNSNVKFLKINNDLCYYVTDTLGKNGEIRRMDKQLFFNGTKAYPLSGVDKSFLLGSDKLDSNFILLVEGATDFLTAKVMGHESGQDCSVLGLLGASCRTIHPSIIEKIRGKHVRICADADEAGEKMKKNWTNLLLDHGCSVDYILLPENEDLTSFLEKQKS